MDIEQIRAAVKGIGKATANNNSEYFVVGKYRVKVLKCKWRESTKPGSKDVFFIAECEVVSSNLTNYFPGKKASWRCNMSHMPSIGNLKNFLSAAVPAKLVSINESYTKEELEAQLSSDEELSKILCSATDETNLFEGLDLGLECFNVKKTNSEGDFTKHVWSV